MYGTQNIYVAAALLACEHQYQHAVKNDRGRVTFVFEGDAWVMQQCEKQYRSNELVLHVRGYIDALMTIHDELSKALAA